MTTATRSFINRLALVFDFDDTLAPDSFGFLLQRLGFDPDTFRGERITPLVEAGWDESLARFYALIEASDESDTPVTKELLLDIGREIEIFEGVPEMFGRVREAAQRVLPEVEVEFYLLSSGIVEIAQGTPIAGEFREMWGCEFHFGDEGRLRFVKQIITHPEKVRYLLGLAKGIDTRGEGGHPSDVYRDVPEKEMHVPLSQTVYLGDGSSDMPAFSLLNEGGGVALGLVKDAHVESWRGNRDVHAGRRVQNLAKVDYRESSELMQSILLSAESICKRIALRKLSQGE